MDAGHGHELTDEPQPDVAVRRVAVLAQHDLVRRRVLHALDDRDFTIVHVPAAKAPEATALTDVAVVVVDGAAGTRRLRSLLAPLRVPAVIVAPSVDSEGVYDALWAGAAGFVSESDLDERLGPTIHAVATGQLVIPAEHRRTVSRPLLSPREKQVMSMVVLGFTNQEVANKLHVTETTVKSHLSSAYRKLGVRSRHEATAMILSNKELGLGILTLAGERTSD